MKAIAIPVVGLTLMLAVLAACSGTASTPTPGDPTVVNRGQGDQLAWLTDLNQRLKNEPVANPPALIAQYEYQGKTVYFVPQRCCDIFSDLYDADGNIIQTTGNIRADT